MRFEKVTRPDLSGDLVIGVVLPGPDRVTMVTLEPCTPVTVSPRGLLAKILGLAAVCAAATTVPGDSAAYAVVADPMAVEPIARAKVMPPRAAIALRFILGLLPDTPKS